MAIEQNNFIYPFKRQRQLTFRPSALHSENVFGFVLSAALERGIAIKSCIDEVDRGHYENCFNSPEPIDLWWLRRNERFVSYDCIVIERPEKFH